MKCVPVKVLMPGEYQFSVQPLRIQTLLGSCVAMIFWHPKKRIGGMCHYVLPSRNCNTGNDARYADEFMRILLTEIDRHGTSPREYQVRLFGAANMFRQLKTTCTDIEPEYSQHSELCQNCANVSCRNRIAAINETRKYGFTVVEADLGGTVYRYVNFMVETGETAVRKAQLVALL
ncbi:chemotaxis protein CheD [Rheinheimera hassiensis]|uniref:chemotaxis protein CheD n=1 Tax=Rheinheimera hassiensis TaxID=1193627 RepID=UPI001F06A8A0|nr:chemotaxis protein CheD [Rheinheimera hassiensis]